MVKVMLAAVTNSQICDGSNSTHTYVSLIKCQTEALIGGGLPDKTSTT
jgi:hypothetical protein